MVTPAYMFGNLFTDIFGGIFSKIRAVKAKKVNKLFDKVDKMTPNLKGITFNVDEYYSTYRAEITDHFYKATWPKRRLFEPEIAFMKRICEQAIKINNENQNKIEIAAK